MVALLVIDDDQTLLKLYYQILQRQGYQVHTADSGEKGVRMFDNGDYALVITDLVMEGMDGNGVADHIRQSEKGIVPIIGISGTPWKAHAPYFDAVMAKPVAMKDLVAGIRFLVGSSGKEVSADVGRVMRP